MKNKQIATLLHCSIAQLLKRNNGTMQQLNNSGFSSLAFITILGLFLAVTLALVGTGTIKLPGNAQLAVSPIQVSDPVEDDTACNDPKNADCEKNLTNDPEDLTPSQIQKLLEEK